MASQNGYVTTLYRSTILIAAVVFTVACSRQQSESAASDLSLKGAAKLSADATAALRITDLNGSAIAGAQVLIGSKENVPFAGNFLKADANGVVTIPAAWANAQNVTVDAPGFVRATYVAQTPGAHMFALRPALVQQPRTVSGTTTGFGDLPNDGIFDVGLVFKTFDLRNLVNFQLTDVVSPRMDTIKVLGQSLKIPTNVTIPEQKETYILPIQFSKPGYGLDLYELGTFHLMAVRAQAPFGKLVKALLSGKSLIEEINDLKFVSAGEEQVTVNDSGAALDIPVGTILFNSSFNWQSPVIDDSTSMMLAVALASDGSTYYPTDIKRFSSNQTFAMNTVAPSNSAKGLVLSVLRSSDENPVGAAAEQISLNFAPMTSMIAPTFLSLLPSPLVSGDPSHPTIAQTPPSAQGLKPLMTSITGAKTSANGLLLTPTWDVLASGWIDHVDLPEWPGETTTVYTSMMRWSVEYGASSSAKADDLPLALEAMQSATHLTRSAVDL